jgi:hypothetical protein
LALKQMIVFSGSNYYGVQVKSPSLISVGLAALALAYALPAAVRADDVGVGRSVQLRSDTPSDQTLLCKATLQPITEDGAAQFGAECTEGPRSDSTSAWPRAIPPPRSPTRSSSLVQVILAPVSSPSLREALHSGDVFQI